MLKTWKLILYRIQWKIYYDIFIQKSLFLSKEANFIPSDPKRMEFYTSTLRENNIPDVQKLKFAMKQPNKKKRNNPFYTFYHNRFKHVRAYILMLSTVDSSASHYFSYVGLLLPRRIVTPTYTFS